MRVAVVGGGISGLAAASALQAHAEVHLYEADQRLGGHTDTHAVEDPLGALQIDTGFIVFNEPNYPQFNAWLKALGVASQPSNMSFGVDNPDSGQAYGSHGLASLFATPRTALRPRFLRMLWDLQRFYRNAGSVSDNDPRTVGFYLQENGYGRAFGQEHLLPMCAALWSQTPLDAERIPIAHVTAFMRHHGMLTLGDRPSWRCVQGGSSTYLGAFTEQFKGQVHIGEAVLTVARSGSGAQLTTAQGQAHFDAAVLACHADQALTLLADADAQESRILSAFRYADNTVVLHSDEAVMPAAQRAWCSWNVRLQADGTNTISYWMNLLQDLRAQRNYFVTLNPVSPPRAVQATRNYRHPIFNAATRAAQTQLPTLNGRNHTYFCGAYGGYGFHEDGFVSGRNAAAQLLAEVQRAAA